jgi:CHAT domain-containing protein
MDSTKLVIISACETGNGELVNNEGVIVFREHSYMQARAARSIVFGKADDKSTSAILKQFHNYLREGYSKSKALQQAKLDYIRINTMKY